MKFNKEEEILWNEYMFMRIETYLLCYLHKNIKNC